MGDESEDFNEKIVKIGGSALLGTSVLTGLFVAIGKSQIAQRAAKKGEDNLDFAKMNEASKWAMKALRRATMYNIIVFGGAISAFCYSYDVRSFADFKKTVQGIKGVQISKEGAKPTTWNDIFPEDSNSKNSN
ncbi:Oidioi.mRNA.OKI2018_I69.XSR.g14160.t1.cds [Oikopleura dioica]|uniref:Oidioi.mRNA.OKI2018_I69.XSR.g14160.t1.cds n=1 Tax=Oikopleura dioica TaxID=34765 RepID=A0ABN7SDV0_OIKDI|nr:Oidioi.mRNA.OKI2018_I69.XSR.g14160.t1.cds [Oikopleura dioica]